MTAKVKNNARYRVPTKYIELRSDCKRSNGDWQEIKVACSSKWQIEEAKLPDWVLIKFDDDTIGSRKKNEDDCVAKTPAVATSQATKR